MNHAGLRTVRASTLVLAFLLSTVMLRALDDEALQLQLRYEPADTISGSLPPDAVPDSFYQPDLGIELVSTPADEARQPRSSNPRRAVEAVNPAELVERLDADRLLLSEIRKAVPENRTEAESYLRRLKELAGKSDPVRLVPLANRVLDQAPIYFDWLDREFDSQDEQITEYYVGGARGFSYALENFRTAVMFTIMNRLDLASQVLSEMQVVE
jgi:hypothetical protein